MTPLFLCTALFLLACHVGLGILFILSFAVHSGKSEHLATAYTSDFSVT